MSPETPLGSGLLRKMLNLFQIIQQKDDQLYIFFDEVQYLRDWEIHLKSLVDSYASYRFAVTGSAAAALKLKSQESSWASHVVFPLTFPNILTSSSGKMN
ncbi:MAG: AAA family ATPase [Nitrosomonadales bacterium]|nr:AAA family ATPase [Nitrosomonadales bacterium]